MASINLILQLTYHSAFLCVEMSFVSYFNSKVFGHKLFSSVFVLSSENVLLCV